jgi:hypothetical protein
MEIIGGGNVVELTREDEWHHERDSHEMWQESVVLCWWDLKNKIGGYHRIGHQPFHASGGKVHFTNNFFTSDCVYKRCEILPLRDKDHFATGYGCGDDTCKFEFTDHAIWTFQQKEASGQLHIRDFHVPVDIYPKKGQLAEQITAGHMEVGGAVTGDISINGKSYHVDGLAFRDHGWGKRLWDVFVCHRWVAGTFGSDLTVLGLSVLSTDNTTADFGCVIRDNKLTYSFDVDILTYLEHDGLTHRGGHLRMKLTTGEVVEMEIEVLQKGVVSWVAETVVTTDTMCKLIFGDRVGICDFEISNNATRGSHYPEFANNGFTKDGLHLL